MNFISQYDQLPRNTNPIVLWVIGIAIVFILWTIFWQSVVGREFSQAKEEFRKNPSNIPNRKRLMEAAKFRIGKASSVLEVMALLDERKEVELPDSKLVAELKSLSDLHENGHLNDQEFEQAKAKLLT